jgi:hypothetical protein
MSLIDDLGLLPGPRPTLVHDKPCGPCPSTREPDEEAEDIRSFVRRGLMPADQTAFACAWRPEKLCRGWCDFVGMTKPDGEP